MSGWASTAASGAWTNAITPTRSRALLAREPEIVDVEDRHVRAAALQQLQRVGRGARLADRELDALRLVEAALARDVDPGVHRVGREVEQQRRRLGRGDRARRPRRSRRARAGRGGGAVATARVQRTMGPDAPPGHLLAQPHALAVADVPGATASTARSRRTSRTCTSRTRSSGSSTAPRAATSRSCWCSPARRPTTIRASPRSSPSSGTPTSPPTWSGSASARSSAGCCRTPTSASSPARTSARLREVTASQGLMLESVNPDLVAHQGSPTKHPERRLETIRAAGELKIPFTSGILVGIGEAEEERVAALEALAAVHARARPPAGGDPAELRPAPELLRAGAGRHRRGGVEGVLAHRHRRRAAARPAEVGDAGRHRGHEAPDRRGQAPAARRRRPGAAEPRRLVARARRRRRDRPRRPERQRRPHLARAPVPVAAQGPQAARPGRRRADRAPVRLRRVHRPGVGRPGRARRDQGAVLELHPAPRLRPPRRAAARAASGDDRARPRRRGADRRGDDGDVRRDAARGDRGHARRRRRAARRAGGRDGDVRRQPQHQRLQRLRRRLRVLRLRPGQALARRLRALARGVRHARRRRARVRRHRDLHPVGHPPRLGAGGLRGLAALRQGARARHPPARLQPDGGRAHVRRLRALAARGLRPPARGRARLDARHRRRGAPRRRARAHLAQQAAGRALGGDHRGLRTPRGCARP